MPPIILVTLIYVCSKNVYKVVMEMWYECSNERGNLRDFWKKDYIASKK